MPKKEIPIEDFVILGRTGHPLKLRMKYYLVEKDRKGIKPAPFEYRMTESKGKQGKTKVMILVDED